MIRKVLHPLGDHRVARRHRIVTPRTLVRIAMPRMVRAVSASSWPGASAR